MGLVRVTILLPEEYLDDIPERLTHIPYIELSTDGVVLRKVRRS